MSKIAFVTYRELPRITADDSTLYSPLAEHGLKLMGAPWDDLTLRWTDFAVIVLRSCWDYHLRLPDFAAWLAQVEDEGVPIWNAPSVVTWNANKTYLRDLASKNVPIIPTEFVTRSDAVELTHLLDEKGWDNAIIKPTVGASAHKVWQVQRDTADRQQRKFERALQDDTLMIQPFMPQIIHDGEWSLVYFRNWEGAIAYSHAVIKRPKARDFRVQPEFGGTTDAISAPPELVAQGRAVVDAVEGEWLYARVDGVVVDGQLLLMELELIEPELYLSKDRLAPKRFAAAIASVLAP